MDAFLPNSYKFEVVGENRDPKNNKRAGQGARPLRGSGGWPPAGCGAEPHGLSSVLVLGGLFLFWLVAFVGKDCWGLCFLGLE